MPHNISEHILTGNLTDTGKNEPKCAVCFRRGAESYSMTHTRPSDY